MLGEVVVANAAEAEKVGEAEIVMEVVLAIGSDKMHAASSDEGRASRRGGTDDSTDERASDNKNSHTYNFGASTITLGRIKEMTEKGYFADGEARAPGAELVPDPGEDEAVMYEDFFVAGLCLPPHPALAAILFKF
jgi:hypothetical protein